MRRELRHLTNSRYNSAMQLDIKHLSESLEYVRRCRRGMDDYQQMNNQREIRELREVILHRSGFLNPDEKALIRCVFDRSCTVNEIGD